MRKKLLVLGLTCVMIVSMIGIFSRVYLAKDNQKPVFILKDESLIEDYSIIREGGSLTGNLYEIDVLYTNEVTSEILNEYAKNVVVPEGTIVVNIKFYNSYKDNTEYQKYSSLKYEIERVL